MSDRLKVRMMREKASEGANDLHGNKRRYELLGGWWMSVAE